MSAVGIISIVRYVISAIGFFFGFYFLSSNLSLAIEIVSLTTVGVVGLVSFISHVIFHKADAKRINFENQNPGFQFEVGFANLAFSLVAIISYFAKWGILANTVLILAFAVYLFQAAILHTWKSFSGKEKNIGHFFKRGFVTFFFSGMMLFFAITAIFSGKL